MSKTVTITRYVETEVEVDVEFTRDELLEALGDVEEDPDQAVTDVIRRIEMEIVAAESLQVRGALMWARDLVRGELE